MQGSTESLFARRWNEAIFASQGFVMENLTITVLSKAWLSINNIVHPENEINSLFNRKFFVKGALKTKICLNF